ncbi:MAG: hypothetical protein V5A43_10940 [Haloarculaceae archaeon]
MSTSGAASLLAGVVLGAPVVLLAPFGLAWGFAIVADSAQFSAPVSELASGSYVGTGFRLRTAVGFLITIASIQLVPVLRDAVGWQWAFAPLVVGPNLGPVAMLSRRRQPQAAHLAGGRG